MYPVDNSLHLFRPTINDSSQIGMVLKFSESRHYISLSPSREILTLGFGYVILNLRGFNSEVQHRKFQFLKMTSALPGKVFESQVSF